MVIGFDQSWKYLSQQQAEQLITGLVAHASLNFLLTERSRLEREQRARPVNPLPPVARRRVPA